MQQNQSAGPVRTAHTSVCCCHTTQHRAVLIIFPLNLQTITITRMLSSGGEEGWHLRGRNAIPWEQYCIS